MLRSTEIDIDKNTKFNTPCLFTPFFVISEFKNPITYLVQKSDGVRIAFESVSKVIGELCLVFVRTA